MRRVLFTIVAGAALVAFVPTSAIARNHHHHHHHRRHHHRVSHHVRIHRFGHFTSGKGDEGNPPSASSSAGTVTSFDPTTGKLVVTLNDGTTTETGLVTGDTEIKCEAMENEQNDMRSDGGPGPSGGDGHGDRGGDQGEDGNGDGDDHGEEQNCSASSLMTGTVVLGAELRISSAGAVWHEIELMP
jgi:hypothetical protein